MIGFGSIVAVRLGIPRNSLEHQADLVPCYLGIDKRSSAELSEAINSMWDYYFKSAYCVAYLVDVKDRMDHQQFQQSEWFARGWTLQELLAPKFVVFCTHQWDIIGTKDLPSDFSTIIEQATGIKQRFLLGRLRIPEACAAQKLQWASKRVTTREEDEAYCLLGLLEVNIPLLYGEGRLKAFLRLQEEFIRRSDDETIFAWTRSVPDDAEWKVGILAARPEWFSSDDSTERITDDHDHYRARPPYTVTNKGLQFAAEGVSLKSLSTSENGSQILVEAIKSSNQLQSSYVEQFVLPLNCLSGSERHITTPLNKNDRMVLIVLERHGKDKWRRVLPRIEDRKRYAALWANGQSKNLNLLVQLQGPPRWLDWKAIEWVETLENRTTRTQRIWVKSE